MAPRRQARDEAQVISIVTARRHRARSSMRDILVWTMDQMLIVVNKESCMLLLQRRAEPRKRLHLYQPCAKRKHTWNLWPFHRRSPLLPTTIDLSLVRPFEPFVKLQSHQASLCAAGCDDVSLKTRSRSARLIRLHSGWIYADRVLQARRAFNLWMRDKRKRGKKEASHRRVLKWE